MAIIGYHQPDMRQREFASRLQGDQIATRGDIRALRHQIAQCVLLQEKTNRDIDWISGAIGDYVTIDDATLRELVWFIERHTD